MNFNLFHTLSWMFKQFETTQFLYLWYLELNQKYLTQKVSKSWVNCTFFTRYLEFSNSLRQHSSIYLWYLEVNEKILTKTFSKSWVNFEIINFIRCLYRYNSWRQHNIISPVILGTKSGMFSTVILTNWLNFNQCLYAVLIVLTVWDNIAPSICNIWK